MFPIFLPSAEYF